jgi:hypothetical protein
MGHESDDEWITEKAPLKVSPARRSRRENLQSFAKHVATGSRRVHVGASYVGQRKFSRPPLKFLGGGPTDVR